MIKHFRSRFFIFFFLLIFLFLPQQSSSQEAGQQDPVKEVAAAKAAASAGELSVFEAYANETVGLYLESRQALRQFGYDIFTSSVDFDATQLMPVGPDYLLGPGDELKVSIWGKVNANIAVVIDRDGKVNLGEFGTLHLAGFTFSEAKEYLIKELSLYYKTSEVKMNVSLGALSSMRVFVVGKAASPGSYTVSSMSSLLNALIIAGGPGKNGTLRDIRVVRVGKTVTVFDAYDLLLKGDKSKDIRLMPDDVIFIPSIGPVVAVSGFVKSPGIYEFKGEATLLDAIELAGGRSELAFSGRVRIDRVSEDGRIIAIESTLDEGAKTFRLRPGDVVTVFEAVPDKKVVRLAGAVNREGEYATGEELTIRGLIGLSGGLKPYAYKKQAELTRVTATNTGPETKKIIVDIERALSGDPEHDIKLAENDYLFIRAVPEWELYRTVQISGEILFAGTYTIKKGEPISALISRAGGFTEKAYLKGAVFTRESVRELQQKQLDEMIARLEQELMSESIQSSESAQDAEAAKIEQAAAAQKAQLISKLKTAKAKGRISINLTNEEKFKGSPSDLALEDGDTLVIPETPAHVLVLGSVYNQTSFVYSKDLDVADYLRSAGGTMRGADTGEIYVLKVDGTAVRKGSSWFPGLMSAGLDPGDTVVVPEKIDRRAWVRDIKDITQILYQIAVTAGVLIVAF